MEQALTRTKINKTRTKKNRRQNDKKFNGKIAFLNRIIKTNNIYTKYLCEEIIKNPTTKEEMSMEIENQISDDDGEDSKSTNGE